MTYSVIPTNTFMVRTAVNPKYAVTQSKKIVAPILILPVYWMSLGRTSCVTLALMEGNESGFTLSFSELEGDNLNDFLQRKFVRSTGQQAIAPQTTQSNAIKASQEPKTEPIFAREEQG